MFVSHMLRRCLLYLIVALLLGVGGLSAQELKLGVDFVTLFDNTEYSGLTQPKSETLFSARLTPKASLNWEKSNTLVVAVDLTKDFGDNVNMLSSKEIQIYYNYSTEQVQLFAGIFPREEMRGLRSDIFFDRYHRFHHNRLSGVMARKESGSGESFVEFAMDYNGKRTFDTREAFELMTAARYHGLQHYAPSHVDHPYNALTLSYREAFANNTVFLDMGFTLESDSKGMGTRQWLGVSVILDNLRK